MKALILGAALFVGAFANANIINFVCRGYTTGGDRVDVAGRYSIDGGEYSAYGDLTVSGTDGDGNSLFSSGGGGGTERFFSEENVTLRSDGQFFNLSARSSNGSVLKIRHNEGSPINDFVSVDLQPTRTKGPYSHEFNRAKCRFK